eukprot:1180616-Rhodomonas_salina.5
MVSIRTSNAPCSANLDFAFRVGPTPDHASICQKVGQHNQHRLVTCMVASFTSGSALAMLPMICGTTISSRKVWRVTSALLRHTISSPVHIDLPSLTDLSAKLGTRVQLIMRGIQVIMRGVIEP